MTSEAKSEERGAKSEERGAKSEERGAIGVTLLASLSSLVEAYGTFAYAYDEPLGKAFFSKVSPLIDGLLEAHPPRGQTHLDLACGTGLAMEHFERRGFVSTGVDASIPMLSVARERATRLITGDLRALPLRLTFDCITCLYDSLNHLLRRRDLLRALRSVRRLMSRDSVFLFDMNRPEVYRSVWSNPEPFESRRADHYLEIRTSYSRWTRQALGTVRGWAEISGKRYRIDEIRRQRAYSRTTILESLRQASLVAVEVIEFDPFPSDGGSGLEKAKWLFAVRTM